MKPLWNAPSLGTLRAGPQQAVTFVVLVGGWLVLLALLILAPLRPIVGSAWGKQPRRVWRSAVCASIGFAILLVVPWSPLFVGFGVPFALPVVAPITEATTLEEMQRIVDAESQAMMYSPLIQWIDFSIVAEAALLPLVIATTVHTRRLRRKSA